MTDLNFQELYDLEALSLEELFELADDIYQHSEEVASESEKIASKSTYTDLPKS